MNFLIDLATHRYYHPRLSFILETFHGNEPSTYMIKDQTCHNVPLNKISCECKLTYSIVRCYIDLDKYKQSKFIFKTNEVELTPLLLLDYRLLFQLFFSDLEQTE